ncbi:MAG: 50S ribosomal protein L6, partial [Candidatus Methanomethylophilaceae archaeon]|nr:50S ribosomal protein L6 [Candidatus Methanomethylophilaceae archaeon]
MTIAGKIESTIAIPGGVSVSYENGTMKVSGPKGELSRNCAYPNISIAVGEGKVDVCCEYPRVKDKAMLGTFVAHI